jgi:hypothetical protein
MFLLIHKEAPLNFWANSPGDVFLKSTMEKLDLDPSEVRLYHYLGLKQAPNNYDLGESGELKIKAMVTKEVDGLEIEEEDIIKVYPADTYFLNGVYAKPC